VYKQPSARFCRFARHWLAQKVACPEAGCHSSALLQLTLPKLVPSSEKGLSRSLTTYARRRWFRLCVTAVASTDGERELSGELCLDKLNGMTFKLQATMKAMTLYSSPL